MNEEPENREHTLNHSGSSDGSPAAEKITTIQQVAPRPTFKVREPSERPARKEKSIYQKFLPPVLGGLAALPLATAILWYGFGKDIGGLGPAVAQYTPWIVPKALRGSAFRSDGTLGAGIPNADRGSATNRSSAQSNPDGVKSRLPSLGSSLPDKPDSLPEQPASLPSVVGDMVPSVTDGLEKAATLTEMPPIDVTEELAKSIERFVDLKNQWASVPRERDAQRQAVADFYESLCVISKLIDVNEPAVAEFWSRQRDSIGETILNDRKFSALVKRCASGEIPDHILLKSGTHGVTIVSLQDDLSENQSAVDRLNVIAKTKVANEACVIEFPAADSRLSSGLHVLPPGAEFLVFFRIEEDGGRFKVVAIDCVVAN